MLFVKHGNCHLVVTVMTAQQECLGFSSQPGQSLFRWTVESHSYQSAAFDLENREAFGCTANTCTSCTALSTIRSDQTVNAS